MPDAAWDTFTQYNYVNMPKYKLMYGHYIESKTQKKS